MNAEIGTIDPLSMPWPSLSDRPVIVFGGVLATGDRRARRLVQTAVEADRDVVWFDAWEGVDDSLSPPQRSSLDVQTERSVVVIGYRDRERSIWVNQIPSVLGTIAAKAIRGRLAWTVMAPTIRAVAEHVASPSCIVYTDAHSRPLAWHAARSVWVDVPAGSELVLGRHSQDPGRRSQR